MRVAASSPAWFTRSAESRNSRCLLFSCFCLGAWTGCSCTESEGLGDVLIERFQPLRFLAKSWKARGVRRALMGNEGDETSAPNCDTAIIKSNQTVVTIQTTVGAKETN